MHSDTAAQCLVAWLVLAIARGSMIAWLQTFLNPVFVACLLDRREQRY